MKKVTAANLLYEIFTKVFDLIVLINKNEITLEEVLEVLREEGLLIESKQGWLEVEILGNDNSRGKLRIAVPKSDLAETMVVFIRKK